MAEGFVRYGVTGTRNLKDEAKPIIDKLLMELPEPPSMFITGAAYGVDTYVALRAAELYPNAVHKLIVPALRYNGPLVKHWLTLDSEQYPVVFMPEGTDYRDRNECIVAQCEALLAFPFLSEKSEPRSGTWMTVRIARSVGRPVLLRRLAVAPGR